MKVKRAGILLIILWTLIILICFRIYYVSFGKINSKVLSTAGNRESTKVLYNSKGVIYDRNLVQLAGKQNVYYLIINPREFDLLKLEYISQITNTEKSIISDKLKHETPFVLQSYVKPVEIKGVNICEGTTRYPEKQVAQHIVGYLDNDCIVGISGVEKAYDNILSKYKSTSTYTYSTNAVNGVIPQMDIKINGGKDSDNGVILTIDRELSFVAEQSLKENCENGCVIVMNCNDGELYTLSSIPSYDVNNIADYTNSTKRELVNNALVNQTVGSVFKIIVAMCALQNNLDSFVFECRGAIEVSGKIFSCQNNKSHGKQTIDDAFANSCNCYFIAVGQLLGYDKIIETSNLLGLDSSIKIAKYLYSQSGKLPKNYGNISIANLSIGQGELLLPPLAVARLTAAICNGGFLVNPTVYKGMYIDNQIVYESDYSYKNNVLTSEISNRLKQMCIQCVINGTGKSAAPDIKTAGGKTASAQTGKNNENGNEILNTYFTGFYPADNPKYVITVFAQNGKSGASTCAPVFKEICNYIGQNY